MKEDTTMTKKEYMKPTMEVVELKHQNQILTGSPYNRNLQDDVVTEGW